MAHNHKKIVYELLERVPPEHLAIDTRLRNYAQWARDRLVQGHCGSPEWQYEEERASADHDERDKRGECQPIDVLEALETFAAVQKLPLKHRLLINLWYVNRLKPEKIRYKIVASEGEFPSIIRSARAMCINLLHLPPRLKAGGFHG